MEQELATFAAEATALWDAVFSQIRNLTLPSRLYQIAILIAAGLVAFVLRRWAGRAFKDWLRTREGWPKWRLRAALVIEQKFGLILFAALSWLAGVQPVNRPGVYDKVPDDKNYSSLHLVCCNGVPGAVVGPD